MQIEIENQLKNNMILNFQNKVYKTKERHFMQIISQAKKDNATFEQKFKAAHDFLNSETLKNIMDALEQQYPSQKLNEGQLKIQ